MKKNRVMRAASAILVLAILTTCIFSGTMAKYIISDNTTDSARVARFGVVINASGDLFGASYAKTTNVIQKWTQTGAYSESVAAFEGADELLVAPGTKNDEGVTFAIVGKPEVSTSIVVDAPEGETSTYNDKDYVNTDVFLKQAAYSIMVPVTASKVTLTDDNCGDYYNYTAGASAGVSGTFAQLTAASDANATIYKRVKLTGAAVADGAVGASTDVMTADYYPIDWYVKANGATSPTKVNGVDAMSADPTKNVGGKVAAALTGATAGTMTATPNTDLAKTVTVTWEWIYSDGAAWADSNPDTVLHNWENTTLRDLEDTTLGQLITLAKGGTDYKIATEVTASAVTTVTEVIYKTIDATATSANQVIVAYTGDTAPASWSAANVACLTASFGARVTVTQVD